jgi:hypothetical protein
MNSIDDPTSSGQLGWPPHRKNVFGFTASRQDPLNDPDATFVYLDALGSLPRTPNGLVTGACIGGDRRIGVWLQMNYAHVPHLILVPADRSRVFDWWSEFITDGASNITVRQMPAGSTYADRNRAIVENSTLLVGFPLHGEGDSRSARSGTWQTIRMARTAHQTGPFIFPLEGQ